MEAVAISPFHETLYGWIHISEQRWIEGLTRDGESLQAAKRVAFAFHEPKRLEEERQDLIDRICPRPPVADVMARGLKMLAEINRMDARLAQEQRELAEEMAEMYGGARPEADNGSN